MPRPTPSYSPIYPRDNVAVSPDCAPVGQRLRSPRSKRLPTLDTEVPIRPVCPAAGAATLACAVLATSALGLSGRLGAQTVPSAGPALPADLSGQEIFLASCAGCHAPDGRGQDQAMVGFDQPLPDFTDCNFASREAAADWVGMAHEGGARNGFSTIMPAFGDALTTEQLERVAAYLKTFCHDRSWPQGELNLPRPMFTEKAYPEDEAVITTAAGLGSGEPMDAQLTYERRFGHQSQLEVVVPFGYRLREDGAGSGRVMGLGDVSVGVKRTLVHSLERGSIFAVGGELKLPTGDPANGFGGGGKAVEGYVAFGQILGESGFLHFQGGGEGPTSGFEVEEAFGRLALGWTHFQDDGWGRAWSPMVEVVGVHDAEEGETLFDVVPQLQVSLNRRQHILASAGLSLPVNERTGRKPQLVFYVLWDWFDGGLLEGW